MKLRFYFLLYIIVLLQSKTLGISIDDYGAVESDNSIESALKNSEAIQNAFKAINQLENEERVVTIPEGKTYYFFPTLIQNTQNFTFQIDGKLIVPDNSIDVYPKSESGYQHALIIQNCQNFKITGYGQIDGQGYDWWWATLTTKVGNDRPHLIYIEQSQSFIIENIRVRNSPFYHIVLYDATNIVIRGIDIKVDVKGQQDLISKYKQMKNEETSFIDKVINWLHPLPMFPFNTDGIDPWASNIHIYNVSIENFDDAVAVKPSNGGFKISKCSENILVENSRVKYGFGMTIGSVPPHENFACVRNVTFRNIQFEKPIKAIYVKTNPGDTGSGIIEKITYENITIYQPIWWGIYIGPQQQKQPDGYGPGCMLYPLNKDCPTQPRVPIKDITLKNVTSVGGWFSPGILRCNETAPCTGWVFEDVKVQGWASSWGWYCENIYGVAKNVYPDPGCFKQQEVEQPKGILYKKHG